MHCLTYPIGLDAAVIDFVISLLGEPDAEYECEDYQVPTLPAMRILTGYAGDRGAERPDNDYLSRW
jgi:hypothetical protein